MIFRGSLNDSKSRLIYINILVSMVLDNPTISNSPSPLSKPLGAIPSVAITTGITIIVRLHRLLSSLARFKFLALFLFSLIFTLLSAGTAKTRIRRISSFFFF